MCLWVSDPAFIAFPQAMDLQSRILKRVPLEQPERIPSEKQLAASICVQFGEHYLEEKEYAKAMRSYKDALAYSPTDNKVWSSKPDPASSLGVRCRAALPGQGRGQFLLCTSLRSSGVHLVWGPLMWGACSS